MVLKKRKAVKQTGGSSELHSMFDLGHSKNVLKIEHLSENSEENVIQLYYKAYHLSEKTAK